ncbi:MAG: TolC family protein [Acidobacteriota bacterium]|nr:TolC family protein [Acidobacteriota bacterium]
MSRSRLLLIAAAAAAIATRSPAASITAAVPRDLPAPEVRAAKLTLQEAVRLTLENAPDVLKGRLEVLRQKGVLQSASGRFDHSIVLSPSYERTKSILTASAVAGEQSKRDFLRDSSSNLSTIASDINRNLADPNGKANVDCKGHQYFINGSSICSDVIQPTDYKTFQLLDAAEKLPFDPNSPDARLQAALNKAVSDRLRNVVALIRRVFIPALDEQLAAIGALPAGNENDTLILDLRYEIPLRAGPVFSPVIYGQSTRTNFFDKAFSPVTGGQGIPTLYRVVAGFDLQLPLLKSGGTASVTAEEQSARHNYESAQESLAQTASAVVLNTVVRYWTLAGNQEQLDLLQQSASAQRRLVEQSDALVKGDELARSELDRVRASVLDVDASVMKARQAVESARVELARGMGLTVTDLDAAPFAADPLPSGEDLDRVASVALGELVAGAARQRADVKAARAKVAAADALLAGARVDLRPTLDLSLQAGYNAIWEDGAFNINAAINPTGLYRAIGQPWIGPSVQVGVKLGIPVGNHRARGRVVQYEALRGQSLITERETLRGAQIDLVNVVESARAAAREVSFRSAASRYGIETSRGSAERYKAGDLTSFDAVQTEQQLTRSLLDGLGARLSLASLVARIRYESGLLLPYSISAGEVSFAQAMPLLPPGRVP